MHHTDFTALFLVGVALLPFVQADVIVTSTITETVNQTYRAGLILINSMTISGTDAYAKEFSVDNVAEITFANSVLNVFAVPTTATCAYISKVIIDLPDINLENIQDPEQWIDE